MQSLPSGAPQGSSSPGEQRLTASSSAEAPPRSGHATNATSRRRRRPSATLGERETDAATTATAASTSPPETSDALHLPTSPLTIRLALVPVSSAFLFLVCLVSFLFGTLSPHHRGLLRATGSSSPVRISLHGPFATFTEASLTNAPAAVTMTQAHTEPDVSGAITLLGEHTDADRKGNETPSGVHGAWASFPLSALSFFHRFSMATLLVVSSGELAYVAAAFYGYVFDLEKRLLGSRRFAVLLVVACLLRMLWVAVTDTTVLRRLLSWRDGMSSSSMTDAQAAALALEKNVGLRPGPTWLCLLLLIVYEKRCRHAPPATAFPGGAAHAAGNQTMGAGQAYQPVPVVVTREAEEAAAATAPAAEAAGGRHAETSSTGAVTESVQQGETADEAALRTSDGFTTFPFGSSAGTVRRARVYLFGKIPLCAGTFRTAIALHLIIRMGFWEETFPALVLGLIL